MSKKSDRLLVSIREGKPMLSGEMLSLIVGLSIPSILAQITNVMMFFIDQAMVGSLGAEAPASIGLVESTLWLFGGLAGATSMGFSVQVAHFIGANDFVRARQVVRHALMGCAVHEPVAHADHCLADLQSYLPYWLGGGADIAPDASRYFLIFSMAVPFMQFNNLAASMLKCEGSMRIASTMSVMLCVLDMILNFFLIFPTRQVQLMGLALTIPRAGLCVTGAAMGTALAYAISHGDTVFWRSPILSLRRAGEPFKYMGSYIWQAVKISVPMGFQSMLMGGAQVVSTMIVAPLGNIAIAANTFAITAESLCYMPGYGIGEAATTLVGQSKGAGRLDLCRSFAWMTVGMGMAVMALMGVVMYVFAPEMMALMTPVAEIRHLGAQVPCASKPLPNLCLPPLSLPTVSVWERVTRCVQPPSTWHPCGAYDSPSPQCWPRTTDLQGVWTAMAIELSLRGLLFLLRLWRGKWMEKGLSLK